MKKEFVRKSKFLSLVLRHKPETIGLQLDKNGWADVDDLLRRAVQSNVALDGAMLREIVESNDKQRFILSEDGRRIRANQGHSLAVDLGLDPIKPPECLFHGTAERSLGSIRESGLVRRNRQHVHLSNDRETAIKVGGRHGRPIVLQVKASDMWRDGHVFYRSENGVWLVNHVPTEYLKFPEQP